MKPSSTHTLVTCCWPDVLQVTESEAGSDESHGCTDYLHSYTCMFPTPLTSLFKTKETLGKEILLNVAPGRDKQVVKCLLSFVSRHKELPPVDTQTSHRQAKPNKKKSNSSVGFHRRQQNRLVLIVWHNYAFKDNKGSITLGTKHIIMSCFPQQDRYTSTLLQRTLRCIT